MRRPSPGLVIPCEGLTTEEGHSSCSPPAFPRATRIAAALRELETHGHLRRERTRTPGGRIVTRTVSCNQPGRRREDGLAQAAEPARPKKAPRKPLPPEVVSRSNPDNDWVGKVRDHPLVGIPVYAVFDPRTGAAFTDIHSTPDGPRYDTREDFVHGEEVTIADWTISTDGLPLYG